LTSDMVAVHDECIRVVTRSREGWDWSPYGKQVEVCMTLGQEACDAKGNGHRRRRERYRWQKMQE
jgi:hypothetical protein